MKSLWKAARGGGKQRVRQFKRRIPLEPPRELD
jgi:hypothetical protein